MIAIIYDGKSKYVSPIFALKNKGWRSEVLAFDESYSCVKRIKMWRYSRQGFIFGSSRQYRQVFIVEWTDFADKSGAWQGEPWIINNKKLLNSLRCKKSVSIGDYPEFKKFANKIDLPEWFEIKSQKDIVNLAEVSFDFHDAIIKQAHQTENNLEILIDTTWDCYITVRFIDIIDADIINQVGQILDSEIKFVEDGIKWTVTDGFAGWIDNIEYSKPFGQPYVKCKKILWKIDV